MRIRVFDTETTGLGNSATICELGYTDIVTPSPGIYLIDKQYSSLLDPEQKIETSAFAIHGIANQECVGAPSHKYASNFLHWYDPPDFLVAHNLKFDIRFIDPRGVKTICTLICCKDVFPGHRNYKNATLFKELGGHDVIDISKITPAHRVLPDTMMTAYIMLKLLEQRTPEELAAITAGKPYGNKIWFGKYKGLAVDDKLVPTDYLIWLASQEWLNKEGREMIAPELIRRGVIV